MKRDFFDGLRQSVMVQLRGRTKSLFSTMKKLLRLDEFSRGGRDRGEVFDLLGLRVIVSHSGSASSEEGEAVAAQVSQLASAGHECCHKLTETLGHACIEPVGVPDTCSD